jgi:hypothetical protein
MAVQAEEGRPLVVQLAGMRELACVREEIAFEPGAADIEEGDGDTGAVSRSASSVR